MKLFHFLFVLICYGSVMPTVTMEQKIEKVPNKYSTFVLSNQIGASAPPSDDNYDSNDGMPEDSNYFIRTETQNRHNIHEDSVNSDFQNEGSCSSGTKQTSPLFLYPPVQPRIKKSNQKESKREIKYRSNDLAAHLIMRRAICQSAQQLGLKVPSRDIISVKCILKKLEWDDRIKITLDQCTFNENNQDTLDARLIKECKQNSELYLIGNDRTKNYWDFCESEISSFNSGQLSYYPEYDFEDSNAPLANVIHLMLLKNEDFCAQSNLKYAEAEKVPESAWTARNDCQKCYESWCKWSKRAWWLFGAISLFKICSRKFSRRAYVGISAAILGIPYVLRWRAEKTYEKAKKTANNLQCAYTKNVNEKQKKASQAHKSYSDACEIFKKSCVTGWWQEADSTRPELIRWLNAQKVSIDVDDFIQWLKGNNRILTPEQIDEQTRIIRGEN